MSNVGKECNGAAKTKWAAVAGPPIPGPKWFRSGEVAGNVVQRIQHAAADGFHGDDGGDGDQRSDQRVLDGGGAMLALHQAAENGQHLNIS